MVESNSNQFRTQLIKTFEGNNDITPLKALSIIEQQLLYNDTLSDVDNDVNSHKFLHAFRLMSVPVVMRTLHNIKIPHLVDFDPVEDFVQPVTRHKMKTIFPYPHTSQTELTVLIAQQLALELDQHVLSELRDRAGVVAYIDPDINSPTDEDFSSRLWDVFKEVEKRSNFVPNWVVASSEVAEYLTAIASDYQPTSDSDHPLGIRCLGMLSWQGPNNQFVYQKLFENTQIPEHEMLLGYKGQAATPFKFQPKILLEALPSRRKNQKVTRARLQTQFKTTWTDNGGNFFARINVKSP